MCTSTVESTLTVLSQRHRFKQKKIPKSSRQFQGTNYTVRNSGCIQ